MAKRLYAGTDQGIFTLANENGAWEIQGQDLNLWSVQGLMVDPDAPERVYAATRGDGIWVTEDEGGTWKKPNNGKPGPGKARSVILDPQDSRRVFVGGEPIDLYYSNDRGASWDKITSVRELPFIDGIHYGARAEPHLRNVAIDPKDSNIIYAALQIGGIIKSTDGGSSWRHIEDEIDCDVHTIVIDPDDTNTIVIATGGAESRTGRVKGRGFYRTADGGDTWIPVGLEFSQEYAMPLVQNPNNSHVLYAALANKTPSNWERRPTGAEAVIIRSPNGGLNWERMDTGTPNESHDFAWGFAVDPEDPKTIFAGVDSGILITHDDGDTWEKQAFSFPRGYDLKCA